MNIKIIDVSHWQEWLNLKLVSLPKDIKGIMIRCGMCADSDGTTLYKDNTFEKFYKDAKSLGLYIGAYYYSCAVDSKTALREAKHCLKLIKGKAFDLPIYMDLECKQRFKSRTDSTDAVLTFIKTVSDAGYRCGLYSNPDWLKNRLDQTRLKDISLWLAYWTSAIGKPSIPCDIWQYGHIYVNGGMIDSDYIMNKGVINMDKIYNNIEEITNEEMREAVEYFIKKEVIKTDSKGKFNINQTKLECITLMHRVLKKMFITL